MDDPTRWPRWHLNNGDPEAIMAAARRALDRDDVPQVIERSGERVAVLGCTHPGIADALTGSAMQTCTECGTLITDGFLIL